MSARVNDARNDGAHLILPVGRRRPSPAAREATPPDRPLFSDEDAQGSLF